MRLRIPKAILFAALITLAVPLPAQTPADAVIDQALATWQQTRKRSLDGIPDPAAAVATQGIDIAQLDGAQLERLCAAMLPQTAAPALRERCLLRLQELARAETADGAVASARLCELVGRPERDAPPEQVAQAAQRRLAAIATAAKHSGLAAAVASGRGMSLFLQVYFLRDPKALADAGVVAALLPLVTPEWPPARVRDLLAFQETAAEAEAGLDAAAREQLRITSLSVLERALAAADLPARERTYLQHRREHLLGAAARGQLIGQPAPKIEVLWSNADPAPASFADLRGKIVVVDFWATWCVPCVAAFPHLRQLVQRYQGLPVTVVGITSLQGYVVYPKATEAKQRRVTTPEAKDELARLPAWCKDMDVTWTVLVTQQDCFNPDFGVRSIPQLAVIDAEGRVRASGVSAEGTAVEDQIDALLRAMGREVPARESGR